MTLRSVVIATLVALTALPSVATSTAASPEKRPELPDVASRSYAQNFKDLGLSSCVAADASEPKAAADAGATAGGLDSIWTNYDPKLAAGDLSKLIEKYLARQQNSIHGPSIKLDLMKCMDLYHSKDLDLLTKRVVPKPNRTYRQDNGSARKKP